MTLQVHVGYACINCSRISVCVCDLYVSDALERYEDRTILFLQANTVTAASTVCSFDKSCSSASNYTDESSQMFKQICSFSMSMWWMSSIDFVHKAKTIETKMNAWPVQDNKGALPGWATIFQCVSRKTVNKDWIKTTKRVVYICECDLDSLLPRWSVVSYSEVGKINQKNNHLYVYTGL